MDADKRLADHLALELLPLADIDSNGICRSCISCGACRDWVEAMAVDASLQAGYDISAGWLASVVIDGDGLEWLDHDSSVDEVIEVYEAEGE